MESIPIVVYRALLGEPVGFNEREQRQKVFTEKCVGYPVTYCETRPKRKRSNIPTVCIKKTTDTYSSSIFAGINFMAVGETECDKIVSIISRGVVDVRATEKFLENQDWCWILQELGTSEDPVFRCFVDIRGQSPFDQTELKYSTDPRATDDSHDKTKFLDFDIGYSKTPPPNSDTQLGDKLSLVANESDKKKGINLIKKYCFQACNGLEASENHCTITRKDDFIKACDEMPTLTPFGITLWPYVEAEKLKCEKSGLPYMTAGVATVFIKEDCWDDGYKPGVTLFSPFDHMEYLILEVHQDSQSLRLKLINNRSLM